MGYKENGIKRYRFIGGTEGGGSCTCAELNGQVFNVEDAEWKDAIEGRMGRLKLSLVTEPKYAHDAAELFREMKKYEEVDLINTDAIAGSNSPVDDNALYEAVQTDIPYIDACLKRYLGRIRKCHTVEELERVRDGVTPDCYSYSNFDLPPSAEK